MVIRIWYPCIVLSCFVIPCLFAKTFSLNEAIAAEERQKNLQTTSRIEPETSDAFSHKKVLRTNPIKPKKYKKSVFAEHSDRFSLIKALRTKLRNNPLKKAAENIFPRSKKLSPLQYRKTFQIKSPLKPKKITSFEKSRRRRRNQSIKREISDDDKISKKYIPLLRSLGLLFDNMLDEPNDSIENRRTRIRKYRHSKQTQCTCTTKPDIDTGNTEPTEETIVSTTPNILNNEVSTIEPTQSTTTEASTTTTDSPSNSDVGDLRQNTDIPAILSRDPHSTRGKHNGISKGSSPTLHTGIQGNISGDHGDSKRDTGSGEHKPHTKTHEEDPDGTAREYTSSTGLGRGLRGDISDTRHPVYRRGSDETVVSTERKDYDDFRTDRRHVDEFERQNNSQRKNGFRDIGGDFYKSAGENKYEIGRDETKRPGSVQQFVRGDRRFESESNVDENTQAQEDREKGIVGIPHFITSNQQLTNRNGAFTSEDQKISATNTALMKDLSNSIVMLQKSPNHKAPFVTITDGYSVARDKNGANKLAEQSIRFHS